MIRLANFGLFSVTHASIPEESKMVMLAFSKSIAWQIGSVTSTRLLKTNCKSEKKDLFKTSDFRCIRNFGKATELTKMSGILEKNKK